MAYVILSYMQCRLRTRGILAVEGLEKLQPVYKVYLSHGKENFNWAKVVILTRGKVRTLGMVLWDALLSAVVTI